MISLQLQRDEMNSRRNVDGGHGGRPPYQVAVLGGGPAGLTAGMYAARAGLRTILLEKQMLGGQVATTDLIENYPCCPEGVSGAHLMAQVEGQARRFGLEIEIGEALGLSLHGDLKVLHTDNGDLQAQTLIIATGAHPATLGVPGEEELRSRGVSYCATCDGPFYRGKVVGVIGGGDSAVQEAIYLTRFASRVVVIHRRDALRAQAVLQQRAFANPKIEFLWHTTVEAFVGGDTIDHLLLRNVLTGEGSRLQVDGAFVYVGQRPNTDFLRGVVALDARGFIYTDEEMCTNVAGIFAAGDVRVKAFRQMVTAASDGAIAANAADHYLERHGQAVAAQAS